MPFAISIARRAVRDRFDRRLDRVADEVEAEGEAPLVDHEVDASEVDVAPEVDVVEGDDRQQVVRRRRRREAPDRGPHHLEALERRGLHRPERARRDPASPRRRPTPPRPSQPCRCGTPPARSLPERASSRGSPPSSRGSGPAPRRSSRRSDPGSPSSWRASSRDRRRPWARSWKSARTSSRAPGAPAPSPPLAPDPDPERAERRRREERTLSFWKRDRPPFGARVVGIRFPGPPHRNVICVTTTYDVPEAGATMNFARSGKLQRRVEASHVVDPHALGWKRRYRGSTRRLPPPEVRALTDRRPPTSSRPLRTENWDLRP